MDTKSNNNSLLLHVYVQKTLLFFLAGVSLEDARTFKLTVLQNAVAGGVCVCVCAGFPIITTHYRTRIITPSLRVLLFFTNNTPAPFFLSSSSLLSLFF